MIAPLLALYTARFGRPAVAAIEHVLTMAGDLLFRSIDIAAALFENAGGVGVHLVGNENSGTGHGKFLPVVIPDLIRDRARHALGNRGERPRLGGRGDANTHGENQPFLTFS